MIETFYELDELVDGDPAPCARALALPIVSLLTFDEDSQTLGGVSAEEAASALAELDVAAIGANHGVGLAGGASRHRADARQRQAARRAAERRPREPRRRASHLPARDAGVLRRVRRARTRARRAHHRRLLRDDSDGDRGDPERGRRGPQPAHAARRARARDRRLRRRSRERETLLQRKLREGEFVVSVEIDPPRGGERARDARAGADAPGLRATSTSSTSTTTRARERA